MNYDAYYRGDAPSTSLLGPMGPGYAPPPFNANYRSPFYQMPAQLRRQPQQGTTFGYSPIGSRRLPIGMGRPSWWMQNHPYYGQLHNQAVQAPMTLRGGGGYGRIPYGDDALPSKPRLMY